MASHTEIFDITARITSPAVDFARTMFLFTYTDYKTIFFPITIFAVCCAPVHSALHLFCGMLWIWLHLLQCNVSNQYKTAEEDKVVRPWRPLPSGRISNRDAEILRWTLCILCIGVSTLRGADVVFMSFLLTLTMIVYDEVGLSGHWIGKNVSAVSGYFTFEVGATKIMGFSSILDNVASRAVACSALIILSTIHCQDFSDVEGDRAIGRVTVPIFAPRQSRPFTMLALVAWSVFLAWFWELGWLCTSIFCALGWYIGWRYFALRSVKEDSSSYVWYNVWLLTCHLLPIHARWGIFDF